MEKKKLILAAIFIVMLFGTAVMTYANAKRITAKDLKNLDDPTTKIKVSQILVEDMKKNEIANPNEIKSITATHGSVINQRDDDVVIVGKYGPELALVGVYKKANGVYNFMGELGVFFDVREVNSLNLKNLNKDAVFLKEYTDQNIGVFERTTFLRGYIWEDGGFKLVYSEPEQIIADWNKNLNSDKDGVESLWNRVTQTSKTKLENGNYPIIKAERTQNYLKSSDTTAKNIPADSTFSEVAKREVCERYYWSEPWERFILSEKIDKTTGEKIAVIEDWQNLTFSIVPNSEAYSNKVRIMRKDCSTDIVDRDALMDVKENKNTIDET